MTYTKKHSVIFLKPGPTYNPNCPIVQSKYIALSPFLKGYILTSSDSDETIQVGNFKYCSFARKRFLNIRYLLFCLISAYEIKKKDRVDCIVSYDPLKTGLVGCFLKIILGAKLIVEVNGVYTSKDAWGDEGRGVVIKIKRFCAPIIMRYVLRNADGVKLLFATQVEDFKNTVQEKKVEVFPDWVPTSLFRNLSDNNEVLFVGFPFLIKGVDILIKSFKLIAPQFPEWKLKILGWYPDRAILDAAIGDHPQIYYHPPVSYSEIPRHVGECGLFVLPSRTEAMGRVLLESAAAGKPRIGSNVGGIPTVINDGEDGFLFDSLNVEQLAEKMSMLMADPALRDKVGTAAKKRVKDEFTEQKYVENYLSLIEKVVLM